MLGDKREREPGKVDRGEHDPVLEHVGIPGAPDARPRVVPGQVERPVRDKVDVNRPAILAIGLLLLQA